MIEKYVTDLAERMKIPLTGVSIVNNNPIAGYSDIHLLRLSSEGIVSAALLWQSDLDGVQSGLCCEPLETKVRAALKRLEIQVEP